MARTKIEWATESWNPITGCSPVSEGCQNCYAQGFARRFWGQRAFGEVRLDEAKLDAPLHWAKPRRVFVDSMGDLWHPGVDWRWLRVVFEIMEMANRHTFLILTKRTRKALEWHRTLGEHFKWPGNVWLGSSIECQKWVDQRIPALLEMPANLFVSVEPMIGEVDLRFAQHGNGWCANPLAGISCDEDLHFRVGCNRLKWVICGGENGSGARPVHPNWVRGLRDQCQMFGTPFFFKGWGEWAPSCELGAMSSELRRYSNHFWEDGEVSYAVGRKLSGRLLDGREWLEFPEF